MRALHLWASLTKLYNLVLAKAGMEIGTPCDALALYFMWSCSISWFLAEDYGNGDQRHVFQHVFTFPFKMFSE